MLQNTIQIPCTEETYFFPHYWLLASISQDYLGVVWIRYLISSLLVAKSSYWDDFFNTQQIVFLYIVSFLCCMLLLVSAWLFAQYMIVLLLFYCLLVNISSFRVFEKLIKLKWLHFLHNPFGTIPNKMINYVIGVLFLSLKDVWNGFSYLVKLICIFDILWTIIQIPVNLLIV